MIEANPATAATDHRDDAELARDAQDDIQSFVVLYERYRLAVYRLSLTRLRERQAAEDATSETFLKALQGLRRFRGGNFAAWLMTIARHAIIDVARQRRATHAPSTDVRDPTATPDEFVERWSDLEELADALDQLTDEQRSVVELQLTGLTGPEIAAAIGKSHDAVKMLRLRAMRRLREVMRDDYRTGGEQ